MKIEIEHWETFFPDCLALLAEHSAELSGKNDKAPFDLNAEAFSAMDKADVLQIVSARDNGVLIGYCMFDIGFSLESKNLLCGTLRPFFVKKECRGTLGIKLFLKSVDALKERGVRQIYVHHYLTSNSKKLQKFFQRIGAKPVQHEYSLWVGE